MAFRSGAASERLWDIVYSGPIYDAMKVEGDKVRIVFKQIDGGLLVAQAPATKPVTGKNNPVSAASAGPLKLAGSPSAAPTDRQFVATDAAIDGNSVVLSKPDSRQLQVDR